MNKNNLSIKYIFLVMVCFFCYSSRSQNIINGEPVQIVGQMNGYSTASTSNSVYRKISTTISNSSDGRGQWAKTYNVQNSGGDFTPSNMGGGTSNGFLFISGPTGNRFLNKWTFSSVSAASINNINSISSYSNSGAGVDMGLNMNSTGRYTFVFNDAGYTSINARFCVSYTAAAPITLTRSSQTLNTNRTTTIGITASAAPSTGENIYIRYTTASDFSSSNSSSIVQATGSGTNWTATIPALASGSVVKYYVFSSTVSSLASISEVDKSLAAINFDDNSGANYQFTIPFYNISRCETPTPVICGSLTAYTVNIIGTDTFSGPYQWQLINSNDSTLSVTNDVTTQSLGNKTQSVQFRLWRRIARVGTTNPDTSNWVLVSMNTPTLTNASTSNICSGASSNITLTASTSSTFAWTLGTNTGSISGASASNGSTINQTLINPSNAIAGSIIYNITPTSTSGSCVGATSPITVTVNPKPTVTNSNSATICSGTSPNISLTASATSTFVWTLGTNTGSISGASASYGSSINQTLTNPSNASVGSVIYNVIPTSTSGSCAGSSTPITINVNPTPTVTNSNSNTVCTGTSPSLSLTASTTSTFAWTLGTNVGSISGASPSNGSTINQTLTNPSNASAGSIIYNVTPTSTVGLCVGASLPITVNVLPRPIMTGANSQTICSGISSLISLTSTSTGGSNSFSWSTLGNSNLSGFNVSGTTTQIGSHTIVNNVTTPQNLVYTITPTFTNNSVSCVGSSSNFTYTINPRPLVNSASSQTICSGLSTTVNLTANTSGGSNTFTWNTSGNSNLSGFNVSGSSSQIGSHTISNTATSPQNLVYTIIPSFTNNSVSCAGSSANYTYTINPTPSVNSPSSQTVCSGASSSVPLTANTSGGTNTFVWSNSGNSNLTGYSGSGTTSQIGSHNILNIATTPQNLVYTITPTFTNNSVSCVGSSSTNTYTINPIPSVTSSTSQTVCSGVTSSVSLLANTSGGSNSFTWSTLGNTKLSGFTVSGTTSIIGLHTIIDTAITPQNLVYTITPIFTNNSVACSGSNSNYTYTINPRPAVNSPNSQTVCTGVPSSVSITANTSGGTNSFTWVTQGNSNLTNYLPNGNLNSIGSHTINNNATTPQNLIYSITPIFTNNSVSCSGVNSNYTFIINPRPVVTSNSAQTICSGSSSSVNLIANTSGGSNTFDWSTSGNSNLSGFNINGSTSQIGTHTILNNAFTNQDLVYNITPTFTNNSIACIGTNAIYTYTINPIPNVYFDDSINFGSSKQVICSGTSFKTTKFKTDYDATGNKMRFDWLNLNTPSIQGLTLTGTGNIPSATLSITPNKPDSILYSTTPYFTNNAVTCAGSAINTKIIVNPIPGSYNPFNVVTYCSDNTLDVNAWSFTTSSSPLGKTDYVWNTSSIPINVNVNGITKTGSNTRVPNTEIISTFNSSNDKKVDLTYKVTPTFTYSGKACVGPDGNYTITINPKPQLPIFTKMNGLNPDSVCYNSKYINYSVDKVSINNDVNNYNYFWEVRPKNLPIVQSKQSNLSLIDFTINPPGGKDVYVTNTLVNNFGCNSSDSMKVYVRNNEGPRDGIQVIKRTNPNGKEQLWCLANDADGFQWGVTNKITFKDSVLTDEVINVYNLDINLLNNYYIWVKLSKSDVCAFKYYYNIPSSVNNNLPTIQKGKLIVYPNPAYSELMVKLDNDAISGFEIYNSVGELVYLNEFAQKKISESILDVSSFASGVYFLKVKNDSGSISLAKFFKN